MRIFPFGRAADPDLPRNDQGSGSLNDYLYDLSPRNARVAIVLADSNPYQDAIRAALDHGGAETEAFIARRSAEDERTDARTAVRLFVNQRPTGVVGYLPRSLEAPVEAALGRIADRGRSTRLPARILRTRDGLRVRVAMGPTR